MASLSVIEMLSLLQPGHILSINFLMNEQVNIFAPIDPYEILKSGFLPGPMGSLNDPPPITDSKRLNFKKTINIL